MTGPPEDDPQSDATEAAVEHLAKLALAAAALAERMAARPSVDGEMPVARTQALTRLHLAVGLAQDAMTREAAVDEPATPDGPEP